MKPLLRQYSFSVLATFMALQCAGQSNANHGDTVMVDSSDSGTVIGIFEKKDTIPVDTIRFADCVKPFDEGPVRLYRGGNMTFYGTIGNGCIVDGKEYIYNKEGELIRIKVYKDRKYLCDAPLPQSHDR